MNGQQIANIQRFVDQLSSSHRPHNPAWYDIDDIAEALYLKGWPKRDCKHLTHYVLADRDTLCCAWLCFSWPDFDFGPSIEGTTWGWYNGKTPKRARPEAM